MILYNSRDTRHKHPFGAVKSGEGVTFYLTTEETTEISLCILRDGHNTPSLFAMDKRKGGVGITHVFEEPGLYFYAFRLADGRTLAQGEGGTGTLAADAPWYQLTVYDKDYRAPRNFAGGVMYQIFPDRFAIGSCGVLETPFDDRVLHTAPEDVPHWRPDEKGEVKNNDYFGGNFKGIEEKLPHLAGLGVSCIYLNPVCEAHSNHRYNTANYKKPDPMLGTEEDFKSLCAAAKALGMRVLVDGVFSHTGDDSIYFNRYGRYPEKGAYQGAESPYYDWFKFTRFPTEYVSWWGFKTLPEVIETAPSFVEYVCGEGGVIDYWMGLGAAGFRLDVADELPDDFIEKLRDAVRRNDPDGGILLGEVWEDASNKISYGERRRYLWGRELDSVMNYPFRTAVLDFIRDADAELFCERVMTICENYPAPILSCAMNMLSTHDTARVITALAGEPDRPNDRAWQEKQRLSKDEYLRGVEMSKLAHTLLYGLPGLPCIYYGDEIGMQGYRDPFNRGFMAWADADENLHDHLKALGAARRAAPALAHGTLRFLAAEKGIVAFLREAGAEKALCAVNRSDETVIIPLPDGGKVSLAPWQGVLKRI